MIPRRPVVLVVAALALAAVPGCDLLSSTYTPPEGDFSMRVPATPSVSRKPVPNMPIAVTQRIYECRGRGFSRGVSVITGLGVLPAAMLDTGALFNLTAQSLIQNGGSMHSSRKVTRDGIPGDEFLLTLHDPRNPGPTKALCQMYLVGSSLFVVAYEAVPSQYSDGAARSFVDSFRLLNVPPGAAGNPPPAVAGDAPAPAGPAALPRFPSLGGGKSVWRNAPAPTFAADESSPFGGTSPTPADPIPPRPAAPKFTPPPGFGGGRGVGEDTEFVGGNGGVSRRLVEPGRAMVGIDYALGSWGNEACFSEIRPVFDRDQPVPPGGRRASAPKGYAVGGAEVQTQQFVDAARLIFFRLKPDGTLDPSDRKEGNWVGFARRNRPSTLLGGDGRRVIGVHGRVGIILDGLALVMEDAAP